MLTVSKACSLWVTESCSTQACHAWNIEECHWLLIFWLDSCKVGPPSCLSWHWHLKKGSELLIWRMCTSSFEFQIFCSWPIQFFLSSAAVASFCRFLILSNIQLSGLLREGRQPTFRHLWKTQVWYHSGAMLRNSLFRWWDSCWCWAGTLWSHKSEGILIRFLLFQCQYISLRVVLLVTSYI